MKGASVDQRCLPKDSDSNKASDALPLPLYLTNAVFFTLFFSVVYYLLLRWREKIRNSTPVHVLTLSKIAAIVTFVASFIYLIGFFDIPVYEVHLQHMGCHGVNMVSKGVHNVIDFLNNEFPDMDVIGISGNYCSDKKPVAVNWIEGRGKSVVCENIIEEEIVKKVLKTDVASLVELNMLKKLTCSAMAGALGGVVTIGRLILGFFVDRTEDGACREFRAG